MRLVTLLALATAIALAGCGGSSSGTSSVATTSTTATTAAKPSPPREPSGKLSAAEYASLKKAARIGDTVKNFDHPARDLRSLRKACAEVRAPATKLLQSLTGSCRPLLRFIGAITAFKTQQGECTRAVKAGDVSCYAILLSKLARTARRSIAPSLGVNAVLKQRRLRGKCAKAVGFSSAADVKRVTAIGHEARIASQALYAHTDLAAYVSDIQVLDSDFNALRSGNSKETGVAQLRHCPHE